MSRRNFILLIIILVLIIGVALSLWLMRQEPTTPGEDTGSTNFISQFNPFGNSTPNKPPTDTPPVDISGYIPPEQSTAKLKKISTMPVAGFTVYQKERLKEVPLPDPSATPPPTETPSPSKAPAKPTPPPTEFVPALRYVARATGNVYQTFADKIEERKFSTTVIPKIEEAFLGNNGESVVLRYLDKDEYTIQTFAGSLPKEILGGDTTENNELVGSFLPEGIQNISLLGDKTSIFYLFKSGSGIIGTTFNLFTNKKVQIFDSSFTEWLSSWPNSKLVTLTTKAASGYAGYMYVLDVGTKNLNNVLGPINGLTTLPSPGGKLVLYGDDNLSLGIYDLDTKTSSAIGLRTLPEKCVWGKLSDALYCAVPKLVSGTLPDSWYQGEISFADQVWKIDTATGNTTLLLDPVNTSGEEVDGIKLALDEGENYLFFVNKKDSYLWEFSLK